MKLEDFAYTLPEELIAQYPLKRRDQARLMIINRADGTIGHDTFNNLDQHLPEQSHIVLNNSKVIPARLFGRRETGGRVEIFVLKEVESGVYETLLRPAKKLKEGELVSIDGGSLVAEIIDKERRWVRFNKKNVLNYLEKVGHIPLPPYITRDDKAIDRKYYQTVFAQKPGSVASPTAGLHFTDRLLAKLKKNHAMDKVTLHVNYGTFKPVEEKDITQHQMHFEDYFITKTALAKIQKSRKMGRKVVAVGTTSCRVLETIAHNNTLTGSTNIFMYPGYDFKLTDCLITNFHLPHSTLLMLIYAFGGKKLMQHAYQEAIKEKYRFYSYGDGMLIL
ncbi:S-adenosylmethionine:tRNA ribosyltransferase-isomerase [hydrothermal vent metagenome]|uniref:S-adenosylmethionine:tRNA ribosyltransferase-isomerase n=1 Tax=hydrothermal vent metagenome TaxID=652676 RepID=A0A3B1DDW6_9ZZZZ